MNKRYTFFSVNLTILLFTFLFCMVVNADVVSSIDETDNWFLEDIDAVNGWNYLLNSEDSFSEETIVAVIDTGCDYTHPLLQNALWVNSAEQNGIAGVDDDNNGYIDDIYGVDIYNRDSNPMDDSVSSIKGHGTHVAGTILQTAGVTNTNNPFNIKVMIIKAGDSYGNFSSENVAEALYYAADNGASVINMSLSSVKSPASLQDALTYASKSAILVASSGNKGYATSDSGFSSSADYYPAAYPFVIGVMSHDSNHRLCDFSNWDYNKYSDKEYELSAPGNNIYSSYYNSMYKNMKGTSMSAGIVSGCAALLCAKAHQNHFPYNPTELTSYIMYSGTDDISHNDIYGNSYTFRRINLYNLLSQNIYPELILKDITISENNTLTYNILNHGCNANQVRITLTVNIPDSSPVTHHENVTDINALSGYTGSLSLPFTDKAQEIQVSINITCNNSSDINDTQVYSYDFTKTLSQNPSPDSDRNIPLSGITVSPATMLMQCGDSQQIHVSYLPENTTSLKSVTFTSSNPDIASVDPNGIVTAISSGNTYITVTSSAAHKRQVKVTVYTPVKENINVLPVRLSSTAYNWNGKMHRPSVTIKGLKNGTDYIVSYSSPKSRNIGRYHVTIKGIGKYTGELTLPYDIMGYNGKKYTVGGLRYQITSRSSFSKKSTGKVILAGALSTHISKLDIPNQITIGGKKYKVISVKAHAFKKYTNLSCITFGKNITSIGAYAFCGDVRLKSLKGRSIHDIHVGKNAFLKCPIRL